MAMTEPRDDDLPAGPTTEADEADLAEQRAPIGDEPTAPVSVDPEVDRADALEQAQVVEDDDDYPHDAGDS